MGTDGALGGPRPVCDSACDPVQDGDWGDLACVDDITLNPSQRQRLLVTCKHIDTLLGDIEGTLNAAAAKTVFPNYVSDVTAGQRTTIEEYVARIRGHLLQVLARQSLAPEKPHITATHSIHVNLTFVEIAIAELAPRHMRGYGPLSEQGAADLNGIVAELQSVVTELLRYVLQIRSSDLQDMPALTEPPAKGMA